MEDLDTAASRRTGTGQGASSGSHKRSSRQRRDQRLRAHTRDKLRFITGLQSILQHPGNQLPPIGMALLTALVGTDRSPAPSTARICRYCFHGKCTWGASCRFAHAATAEQQPQQQHQQQTQQQQPCPPESVPHQTSSLDPDVAVFRPTSACAPIAVNELQASPAVTTHEEAQFVTIPDVTVPPATSMSLCQMTRPQLL